MGTKAAIVLDLVQRTGALRPRDLHERHIDPKYLDRLHRAGVVERVARGLYVARAAPISEHHSLVEAAKRVPRGVICLLSALRFHEIGTQSPFEIWLAIDAKGRLPKEPNLPLRIVRFSGDALQRGVEEHEIEGVLVRVYVPAKTIADCFKYRNKIGLDVALEALRDAWGTRRVTMDELFHFARICRVANVMRPYLEALVA